jgi:hypothetical protein
LLGLLQCTTLTAHARGGGAGVGDGQLFLGVITVLVVGYLIAKVPAETLRAMGGFILLASAVIFAINLLSAVL